MQYRKKTEAISAILFVLLILASLIIGGLIAYLWAISSTYNLPKSPSVSVENAVFPQNDFTYFNITALNPSNALSDANITAFEVIIENENATVNVMTTEPSLPFVLKTGSSQNFKCIQNWSYLSGKTLRIEPVLNANATTITLPYVSLTVTGFDTSENANHFNLTLYNSPGSIANVTVTKISVFALAVNFTPSTPAPLQPRQGEEFRCNYDWAFLSGESITIIVDTDIGFEVVYNTGTLQGAVLTVSDVQFDNSDSGRFTMNVDSQNSQAAATLQNVSITLADNTTLGLETIPRLDTPMAITVPPNRTQALICLWNWSLHRDEQINIQVSTKENFSVEGITATVPAVVIWNASDIHFDLHDLLHFSVNVTNAPASLDGINITEVDLDLNATEMTPIAVAPANSSLIVCGYNWTNLVTHDVNVTVHGSYSQNATTVSQTIAQTLPIPFVQIDSASFGYFPTGNPCVNVTVFNSPNSPFNANITEISVTANKVTNPFDGTLSFPQVNSTGYLLYVGASVTFVCPWDWTPYSGQDVTFMVQTTQGTFSITRQAG